MMDISVFIADVFKFGFIIGITFFALSFVFGHGIEMLLSVFKIITK